MMSRTNIFSIQFRIEKSYNKKEILDTRRRAEELRMPMLLKRKETTSKQTNY